MKLVIALFFSLFLQQVVAQSNAEMHYQYDTYYKMMKGYYNRGLNYDAVQYVDSLEGNQYVDKNTTFLFAKLYTLNNEFDKTLFYLEEAVKLGVSKKQVENAYDLDQFRSSNMNIIFEINYDKWHQYYLHSLAQLNVDSVYFNQIKGLRRASREVRKQRVVKNYNDLAPYLKDSTERYLLSRKQDSLNFETLIDLIVLKGFPTYKKVGDAFSVATYILRIIQIEETERTSSRWGEIEPIILKEIKAGNLKPAYYALFQDLNKMISKQPQIYLSYLYGKSLVENPDELNIRRRSIGLCSIQVECWSRAREVPLFLQEVDFK